MVAYLIVRPVTLLSDVNRNTKKWYNIELNVEIVSGKKNVRICIVFLQEIFLGAFVSLKPLLSCTVLPL